MATLQFYLLGESSSTAQSIDVDAQQQDYDSIRHLVASYFCIVEPSGIDFSIDGETLTEVGDVLKAQSPIAITIDGKQASDVQGPRGMYDRKTSQT